MASTFSTTHETNASSALILGFIGQQIIKALFSFMERIIKTKLSLLEQTLEGRPGGLLIRAMLLDVALLRDRLLSLSLFYWEEQRHTTATIMPLLWWD